MILSKNNLIMQYSTNIYEINSSLKKTKKYIFILTNWKNYENHI